MLEVDCGDDQWYQRVSSMVFCIGEHRETSLRELEF